MNKQLLEESLNEIVKRIVEYAHPEKIILIDVTPDIDLLVIKSGADTLHLTQELDMKMVGVGHSVNINVVTPSLCDSSKD